LTIDALGRLVSLRHSTSKKGIDRESDGNSSGNPDADFDFLVGVGPHTKNLCFGFSWKQWVRSSGDPSFGALSNRAGRTLGIGGGQIRGQQGRRIDSLDPAGRGWQGRKSAPVF
jgi:hypothetical protein